MTLDLAYNEYIGKIPKEFQLNFTTKNMAVQTIIDTIFNKKNGLPALIISNANKTRCITLLDNVGSVSHIIFFLKHLMKC